VNVQFAVKSVDQKGRVFLTWTPAPATARLVKPTAGVNSVAVTLRSAGVGGQILFAAKRTGKFGKTLKLTLPASGNPVSFFVAGEFGHPSTALGDALIEARALAPLGVLGMKKCTVRIRKNAQTLTPAERDRFLSAMAKLNAGGAGRFQDFRDTHVNIAIAEEHGNTGFLPWHRAFMLDLERELQAIDPSVALPYWRFDQGAANLFSLQFMGVPNQAGSVQFVAGHPFLTWTTDGQLGISRTMFFAANAAPPGLLDENGTLALGGSPNADYALFRGMEGDPHGFAHTSFGGSISSIGTAAKDPLFFLLHCNVDRLWAKWQHKYKLTSPSQARAFTEIPTNRVGHRLADTMWPWNGVITAPRPPTAPGGTMAPSKVTTVPGNKPTVGSMIDYQGVAGGPPLGFAYDDVPYF
jgi:tyrosinase